MHSRDCFKTTANHLRFWAYGVGFGATDFLLEELLAAFSFERIHLQG